MLLTREQVKGTRAVPYHVDYIGFVHSFSIGKCPTKFVGEMLRIGNDGELYVVFPDSIIADAYAEYFPACRVACFGNYDNAFHLAKVH